MARPCQAEYGAVTIGIDNLAQIAAALGHAPWQLLIDGFRPDAPPKLSLSADDIKRIKALADGLKQIVGH